MARENSKDALIKDFDGKLHHIGVATNSIIETSTIYKNMGYSVSDRIFDPLQNVYVCFVEKKDNPRIELIEPGSDLSPVYNLVAKSGVAPYHFCYEVKDINKAISALKMNKFVMLVKPTVAVAMNNKLICFCYNKAYGLLELIQL